MSELEELMKLLKVNDQIYTNHGTGIAPPGVGVGVGVGAGQGVGPPVQVPPPHGSVLNNSGPMVIMSNYDDVTDVSGLNIERLHRPSSSRGIIANEGSINSASD